MPFANAKFEAYFKFEIRSAKCEVMEDKIMLYSDFVLF